MSEQIEEEMQIPEIEDIQPEQEPQKVQLLTKPFKVRLEARHVKALKKIVKIADALSIEDITFSFNGKSLNIRHLDVSKVALLDATIKLRETTMEDFADEEDVSVFAVTLSQLKRALNIEEPSFKVDDKLHVEGKLNLKDVKVSLPLVDYELSEDVPEPKVDYKVTATVNVKKMIDNVEKVIEDADHLRFVADQKGLTIEFDTVLQSGNIDSYPCTGEGKATYSIDLLKTLGSGDWKLQYSTDMPLKASTEITKTFYEGTTSRKDQIAYIIVFMAPRIEIE